MKVQFFKSTRPAALALLLCAALTLLLAACQPAVPPTAQPEQPTLPTALTGKHVSLDLAGIATGQTVETIPAVPASDDRPYWEVAPEHLRLTLEGYPVSNHLMKAQIFIYPVEKLSEFNPAAGQIEGALTALLSKREEADVMPFLPVFNAAQMMHAQVQYLDFKNGSGVRYLTQFAQGIVPVNSYEMIYTFQGLTADGKFYVAVILPVTHPGLPADDQISADDPRLADFPAYVNETAAWLQEQPAASFAPDLAVLDALIASIEVK